MGRTVTRNRTFLRLLPVIWTPNNIRNIREFSTRRAPNKDRHAKARAEERQKYGNTQDRPFFNPLEPEQPMKDSLANEEGRQDQALWLKAQKRRVGLAKADSSTTNKPKSSQQKKNKQPQGVTAPKNKIEANSPTLNTSKTNNGSKTNKRGNKAKEASEASLDSNISVYFTK